MGDDRNEFVDTWPRDRPSSIPLCKVCNKARGGRVKRRILSMRINENVRIDGNQERSS